MRVRVTGAAGFIGAAFGVDRGVVLGGIPVPASAMLQAVQKCAAGRGVGTVRFDPDPAVQSVMDQAARSIYSARALQPGFKSSASS